MKDDFVIMGFHFHITRFEINFKGKKNHVSRMVNDPQQAICPAWERFLLQFDSWSIIRFCLATNMSSSPEHSVGISEHPMEEKTKTFYYIHFWFPRSFSTKDLQMPARCCFMGEEWLLPVFWGLCLVKL